jgi:hypothetical protein
VGLAGLGQGLGGSGGEATYCLSPLPAPFPSFLAASPAEDDGDEEADPLYIAVVVRFSSGLV